MKDRVESARRKFDEITDKARGDPQYLAQLETDPEEVLRAFGVRSSEDAESLAAEVRRRAVMTDEVQAVRDKLDEISDRARRDPSYRARLQADPEDVLVEEGLNASDAASVAAEMRDQAPGQGPSPFLMCNFTCCRHPATDWSCDPSVLV